MASGRFITLEGGEGAGKSSCLAALVAWLEARVDTVVQTREPGGTPLGETLRSLLLDPEQVAMAPAAELLMVFAARAQHLHERIRPALEAGQWVLCDRFTDASFAYQGGGRGMPDAPIAWLEHFVQDGLTPDLTVLLDVPPEVGLARATRDRDADRFEIEQQAFYRRVHEAYGRRAAADPERFAVVDATQPLDEVIDAVIAAVADRLDLPR